MAVRMIVYHGQLDVLRNLAAGWELTGCARDWSLVKRNEQGCITDCKNVHCDTVASLRRKGLITGTVRNALGQQHSYTLTERGGYLAHLPEELKQVTLRV